MRRYRILKQTPNGGEYYTVELRSLWRWHAVTESTPEANVATWRIEESAMAWIQERLYKPKPIVVCDSITD